tara:strand:+ start:4969 stop:5136 length:168 start_codon:yes stop_codon:yes gene_type:complete
MENYLIKRYVLLALVACFVFLIIPVDEPKGIYYYFVMLLFSIGITLKVWTINKAL